MVEVDELHVRGAFIVEGKSFGDTRGYFREILRQDRYPNEVQSANGVEQISVSRSVRDVVRGLHVSNYSKLVTVVEGEIYDVICDLRPESDTFLRWAAVRLSAANNTQMFVPPGVAHGFMCTSDTSLVIYVQGGVFNSTRERDLDPFDSQLDIYWPKPVAKYILSDKDTHAPSLAVFEPSLCAGIAPRRVLIIGISGQLGQALSRVHVSDHVYGTYCSHEVPGVNKFIDLSDIDYLRSGRFEAFVQSIRPHIMYISAGFTWVDGCENDVPLAHTVNSTAPGLIARVAAKANSKCVFFSTDYVFPGDEDKKWTENDETAPLNTYGKSKLLGEMNVLKAFPDALVVRTTGVFGPDLNEKNFVYTVCKTLSAGQPLRCPVDQFGSPTYSFDLASLVQNLVQTNARGVIHCVGPETFDRCTLAREIAKEFSLPVGPIVETTSAEMQKQVSSTLGKAAMRGRYLGLTSVRLGETYTMRTLKSALKHWKQNPAGMRLPNDQ